MSLRQYGCLSVLLLVSGMVSLAAESPLEPHALSDRQMEQALLEGEVLTVEELPVGVTNPQRVTLRWQGRVLNAAFKQVDEHRISPTHFRRGSELSTLSFSDSYRYERAAYLLDRHLGLGMVPVTVIRSINGKEGALVAWVEGAISEKKRLNKRGVPHPASQRTGQVSHMRLFDALIGNVDRNQGNLLYAAPDWRLHLIDHTRAFRLTRRLPDKFLERTAQLSRECWHALRSLDADSLGPQLQELLTREQIKYVLRRRDRIVKKIESDIQSFGESSILQ